MAPSDIVVTVLGVAVALAAYAWALHRDRVWLEEWASRRGFVVLEGRRLWWGEWGWRLRASFSSWPFGAAGAVFGVTVRDGRGEIRTGKVLLVRGPLWLRSGGETKWDGDLGVADRAREAIRRYRETKAGEYSDG